MGEELHFLLARLMVKIFLKIITDMDNSNWPYQLRYVARAGVIATVVICGFFILLYSMQWGKDISEEWLSTVFLSFLQSFFVVDPFKVLF